MSAISPFLPQPPDNFSTRIASSTVSPTALSIDLDSTAGLPTEGVGVLFKKDASAKIVTGSIEFIHWTGVSGNTITLTDVNDRGLAGSDAGAQSYVADDYFEVWVSSYYQPTTGILVEHNPDGTHKAPVVTETATQTLTNKTLTSPTITGTALASADGLNVSSLYRQAIINGNFDVWQRSVSDTKSGTTNAYGFTADRWWNQVDSGYGGSPANVAYTASRQSFTLGQTDVPYSPKYFHRLAVTTTSTQGTSFSIMRTRYRIEGVHNFAGRKWTLTFYAKADSARNAAVVFVQKFGSGGSPSESVQTLGSSISLTSSWQKFTITVDLPSISGKTLGTAGDDCLEIGFIYYKQDNTVYSLPSGVVGTWATGTFDIAQVQLCAGDVALPFQPKSFEEELRACQRYYEIVGGGSIGRAQSDTAVDFVAKYQVTKRSATQVLSVSPSNPSITELGVGAKTLHASNLAASISSFEGVGLNKIRCQKYLRSRPRSL